MRARKPAMSTVGGRGGRWRLRPVNIIDVFDPSRAAPGAAHMDTCPPPSGGAGQASTRRFQQENALTDIRTLSSREVGQGPARKHGGGGSGDEPPGSV
ncbi:unnamed protein product [Heligmosomoides polygyrus]|uniref:Uncharacterized protein n=1 Tax=Heligmosomoides polygyrus TaxID=6339 RepID=A0A183FQ41_HELPZ|nr:unnamed protein product [Heligmosomoides polygyrus]